MSFHEVSCDAEKLLQDIVSNQNDTGTELFDTLRWNSNYTYTHSLLEELKDNDLCKIQSYIGGPDKITITGRGKDYFLKKEKYEEERKIASININASENSPINLNTGNGQAIQTVSIYTSEQRNAINEFREEVQSSALSQEEKAEVLELLDSMEELKAKNKTSSFKALVNRVNDIVTTSNTLRAIWQGVVQLFG